MAEEQDVTQKISMLEHWKGALAIVMAFGGPWGAWATSGASMETGPLVGTIVASLIAGVGGVYAWVDTSLAEARTRKELAAGDQ